MFLITKFLNQIPKRGYVLIPEIAAGLRTCVKPWLSWLERHPIKQKAAGSIPSQGTCPGCRFHACKRQPIHVSLSPSLSFYLKISKHVLQWGWKQTNKQKTMGNDWFDCPVQVNVLVLCTKGCGSTPGQAIYRRQPIDVSLSHWCFLFFSLSLPPSKINKNIHLGEN